MMVLRRLLPVCVGIFALWSGFVTAGAIDDRVNRHLTRPIGWILLLIGGVVWVAYAAYLFFTSPADLIEKLATGAMVIGILLLLASVIWEQYRSWLTDPYRDLQR